MSKRTIVKVVTANMEDFRDCPLIVLSDDTFVIAHREAIQVFRGYSEYCQNRSRSYSIVDNHQTGQISTPSTWRFGSNQLQRIDADNLFANGYGDLTNPYVKFVGGEALSFLERGIVLWSSDILELATIDYPEPASASLRISEPQQNLIRMIVRQGGAAPVLRAIAMETHAQGEMLRDKTGWLADLDAFTMKVVKLSDETIVLPSWIPEPEPKSEAHIDSPAVKSMVEEAVCQFGVCPALRVIADTIKRRADAVQHHDPVEYAMILDAYDALIAVCETINIK